MRKEMQRKYTESQLPKKLKWEKRPKDENFKANFLSFSCSEDRARARSSMVC